MELTPTGDDGVYSMDILLELEETTPKTDYLDANKYQEGLTPDKLKDVDMSQQVLITNETNESEDAFKIPEGSLCFIHISGCSFDIFSQHLSCAMIIILKFYDYFQGTNVLSMIMPFF